jgi:hypothetical protein
VFLRRGSYRTTGSSTVSAPHHWPGLTSEGLKRGWMRLGVFDPRSLSALFLCVAPFPFAGRNSTPRPHSIPHAKLSLVPSQIVKLVGCRLTTSTSKHPLRSSPQPYALPQSAHNGDLSRYLRQSLNKCATRSTLFLRRQSVQSVATLCACAPPSPTTLYILDNTTFTPHQISKIGGGIHRSLL